MALSQEQDYIFVPFIDIVMEKGCMLCTKDKIWVVLDEVMDNSKWWLDALAGVDRYKSVDFGGKSPREIIADILENPVTEMEDLYDMMHKISEAYQDGVRVYKLADYKMKVQKGFLGSGGNITVKTPGKITHKMVATKIPKPYNVMVKEYYA